MINDLPWYKSKIIVGALISMLGKILVVSGVIGEFAPENVDALTNTVILVISGIGDLMAFGARITQKTAPTITLTKES